MNAFKKKGIRVNIDCNIATKEVCKIVAESLLKYVLYQFKQIPVPIDILEKELTKGEFTLKFSEPFKMENQLSEDSKDSMDPRSYIRQKGLQKRAELANRMRARKRKMWLVKVEKFMNNFKSMLQILENEINNGAVNTIVYSVGTTPLTPKFIFKMHIPRHLNSVCEKSSSSVLKRRILLNMLIAFVNNADILKFTTSNCPVSKLWILFEKETTSEVEEYQSSSNVILRPEFSITPRTKCVEVHFNEQHLITMHMELTPCVNTSFINSCSGSRGTSLINGNILEEGTLSDDLDIQPLEWDDDPQDKKVECVFAKPGSPMKSNTLNCVGVKFPTYTPFRHKESSDRGSTIVAKTPHQGDYCSMIETPVISHGPSTPSPVKRLTRGITELKFTPAKNDQTKTFNWFQIEFSLTGFKDMCSAS